MTAPTTDTTATDRAPVDPTTADPAGGRSAAGPVSPAVVCDLTDAPDTGEERLREYSRLFDAAFASRERTEGGMVWRLRADAGIEAWAKDLAARENACCAFMTNTVTVVDGQVVWEATTIDDPAARAVLDLYYELPEQRWAAVDEVHDRWVAATGVPIVVSEGPMARPAALDEIRSGRTDGNSSGQD